MKPLLSIFSYCPDTDRILILLDLLKKLQILRDRYDIIVVSHSEVPSTVKDLSDYIYIESNNNLIYDFDLRNKFWFQTDNMFLHSSLHYEFSTHRSIYALVHYVLNFAKFKKYYNVHFIEYDINLENISVIDKVQDILMENDSVMFKSEDGWTHGVYFATNLRNFPEEYFVYNEKFIEEELRTVETRMTEHYTPKFLSVNNRNVYFEPTSTISPDNILQKKDSHGNDQLNWCVPVIQKDVDLLYFFIFNEKGNNHKVTVITNINTQSFDSGKKEHWKLAVLGKFSEINEIKILVDDKIKHMIYFNDENRESFIKNNYFYYK